MPIFALALVLFLTAPAASVSPGEVPDRRGRDMIAGSRAAAAPATLKTRPSERGRSRAGSISGRWYLTMRCRPRSGRYIYEIRQRADGSLRGEGRGVSFAAQGASSFIVSGQASGRGFEFLERVDAGFVGRFTGAVDPSGSQVMGTYVNSRIAEACSFSMSRM